VDAPLIRVYNFLREHSRRRRRRYRRLIMATELLSMHYLLEVLLYQVRIHSNYGFLYTYIQQAGQLARYGWNKRIQVRTTRDRKLISVAYWMYVPCLLRIPCYPL